MSNPEYAKLIHDLIIWGIGFTAAEVVAFVIFIIRMNIKIEVMRKENELIHEINTRQSQEFELKMLEIKTNLDGHKLALEDRIIKILDKAEETAGKVEKKAKETADVLSKKQDFFQVSIDLVKDGVNEIGERVAYMSGALDEHLKAAPSNKLNPFNKR